MIAWYIFYAIAKKIKIKNFESVIITLSKEKI